MMSLLKAFSKQTQQVGWVLRVTEHDIMYQNAEKQKGGTDLYQGDPLHLIKYLMSQKVRA